MLASYYLLSQGWAMTTFFPFYIRMYTIFYFWGPFYWADDSFLSSKFFLSFSLFSIHSLSKLWMGSFFQVYYDKLNLNIPFKDSLDAEVPTEQVLGMKEMAIPIFAGILSGLRRVLARRVSLKVLIFSCLFLSWALFMSTKVYSEFFLPVSLSLS